MKAVNALVLVLFSFQLLSAQATDGLNLHKPGAADSKALNTVSFNLSAADLSQLHHIKGKKPSLKTSKIIVNDDTLTVKRIHVRGNTSSYFERKSLNVKTTKKSSFRNSGDKFSLTKFYAISMNMDRNYVRNKISFAVLDLVDVHTPLNCYAELLINGGSEGLYLICYPPDEYAMKAYKAPFVIRRGYGEAMDKVYTNEDVNRQQAQDLKKKFRLVYASSTLSKSGQELYDEISSLLDLNSYFTWLAFNHLFQNGDYADEAYFMWNPEKSKFEIMPWDFDDILKEQPHEGIAERAKSQRDKLIYSLEDELDKKIAGDQFMYNKYVEIYGTLLQTLTSEKLKEVLTAVFNDVYPYYLKEDVIAQSRFDQYGQTDLTKLEADLNSIYQYISVRAGGLLKNMQSATP